MKKSIFFATFIMLAFGASAQKFQKGSIDFLKSQSEVCIVFDFTGVTMDGDTEATYIKERMADEKTPEDAANWKSEWEGTHRTQFTGTFISYCNDELNNLTVGKGYTSAAYTIIVKIVDIDPGNFAGPFSNPSKLRASFQVVKTGETNNVLASLYLKNIYNPASAYQPVEYLRIDMGFGELGKELAKQLNKALK